MTVDATAPRRATLVVSATAVLVAATDTYVVVLALPDMMRGAGLSIDELQRAAPIVTVFLLGYVAMLPLLGKLSDLYGRISLLLVMLGVFTVGSALTAMATDLGTMLAGRFLQGVGGGGLVPVTLAFVADRWDARRRGVPLGIVGAVQELGAVLGPLVGAAILALADWRAIFWVNAAAGLVLAGSLRVVGRQAVAAGASAAGDGTHLRPREQSAETHAASDRGAEAGVDRPVPAAAAGGRGRLLGDLPGVLLLLASVLALVLALTRPLTLRSDVVWGWLFVPLLGETASSSTSAGTMWWSAPIWLAAAALLAGFVVWELVAAHPLLDVRRVARDLHSADIVGGVLVAVCLGSLIGMFATADPAVSLVSDSWPVLLGISVVAGILVVLRQRLAALPLVPRGSLRPAPAWGALLVSLFVGAALVIVLVDVPVFSRTVGGGGSQWEAATLLLRFLVGLPLGALAGGLVLRALPAWLPAATGMAVAAGGLAVMSRWDASSAQGVGDDAVLLLTGLGFGLAVAPVNAALLAVVPGAVHGLGSALLVVSRMVGMLVGLSALTAIGLRRLSEAVSSLPPPTDVCPDQPLTCPEYVSLLSDVALTQVQTTFLGAALCAATAAALAAVLLRRAHV